MKKIENIEELSENGDESFKKRIKVLAGIALSLILIELSIPQSEKDNLMNKIKGYFVKPEPQQIEEQVEEAEPKTSKITIYEMDEGLLQIADPEYEEINGVTFYYAPKGFSMINDICYRIVTWDNEELPEKNIVGLNDGIPMDNKLISIVRPKVRVTDGRVMYSLPEGYVKVGNYGVKILTVEKAETLGR